MSSRLPRKSEEAFTKRPTLEQDVRGRFLGFKVGEFEVVG